ncbi:hypothetical protein IAD21_06386 [Abditibacteriota bacterium]|nr:hypothetical protein IAD21_06386 [Abditibacteriota bacterium]
MSNMKQIGIGIVQYVQDYDSTYPRYLYPNSAGTANISWRQMIQPYIKSTQVLRCPSNTNNNTPTHPAQDGYPETYVSYAASTSTNDTTANANGVGAIGYAVSVPESVIASPSQCIVVVESTAKNSGFEIRIPTYYGVETDNATSMGHLFAGHLSTSNFLFVDGHVKSMKPLRTMNESTTNPAIPNLWTRDNSPFLGTFTQAQQTLTFAENKYK